jgi:PAS domain-containing protein
LSEEVCVPRLDITLASVEVVAERPPALRVVSAERESVDGPGEPPAAWYPVVASAAEPCLLLDAGGLVGAVSAPFLALFGIDAAEDILGRGLLDDVLHLVDFSPGSSRLGPAELDRIPPLQSLRSGGLARGLVRVRVDGAVRTVDAVTTPLRADGQLAGSLTFFAAI